MKSVLFMIDSIGSGGREGEGFAGIRPGGITGGAAGAGRRGQ
jgi:hypothetical protein